MPGPLHIQGLAVRRGAARILQDLSVSLEAGQIVGVIGPNGAGKSTLLAAVAGLLPHGGSARWAGKPLSAAMLSYMPQSTRTQSDLTALESVLLGRHERLGWRVGDADLAAAAAALASLDLEHLAERQLATLSGGQQQLVMLAQRLVRRPELLILDEATSALDLRHQLAVLEHLRAYVRQTGALVLVAIHDLNLAARHSDNLLLLRQGCLVAEGPRDVVLAAPQLRRAYGIEVEILRSADGHPIIVPLSATAA
ncbi:ABC transporter ATP-binding protein [Pelagibius sp. CAU 1746]|uniref:ABC transporter ATP-binding protein n=1 Tax=Pelagibius sp. CAU 1746 TaxID=3140370 RepID=UPI00325A6F4F